MAKLDLKAMSPGAMSRPAGGEGGCVAESALRGKQQCARLQHSLGTCRGYLLSEGTAQ